MSGPRWLSETGLYENMAEEVLAAGVELFEPRFELWSDTAAKRRWLKLPEGATIETSDMDAWRWPVGTKAWKEFVRDGVRVETRLIEKKSDEEWFMMAYIWNDDESDAEAAPDGLDDARGTLHDVPAATLCHSCHNGGPNHLLGLAAIQLAHDGEGLTLLELMDGGQLSHPPEADAGDAGAGAFLTVPGDSKAQAVLGYLHANCSPCHNPGADLFDSVDMDLLLRVSSLDAVESTPAYRTAVNAFTQQLRSERRYRIFGGDPERSELVHRMASRNPLMQMPPIATELADDAALGMITDWIETLPEPEGDGGT